MIESMRQNYRWTKYVSIVWNVTAHALETDDFKSTIVLFVREIRLKYYTRVINSEIININK